MVVVIEQSGDKPQGDTPDGRTWSNGFTLKKTRDGYSWTISVAPADQSIASLEAAIDEAGRIDAKLRKLYGCEPITARLR